MVPHQTICEELDSPPVVDFANRFKKGFVVLLLEKEFLSRAPTVHDVIDGSRILNTKRPSHDNGYYQRRALTVNKRFDPYV